jgi:pimeloyl-ACP methyl ester carboxylesterase
MPDFSEQHLTVNDLPVRALRGGDGPPVVLLHGFAVTADMWRPNLAALVEAGFSVLAVDLPGHGGTFRPARPYRVSDLARWAHDCLAGLGLGRIALIGNSLGGAVATELALAYPEQVTRLVLVDALGLDPHIPLFRRARYWTDLIFPTIWIMAFGLRRRALRRIARITFHRPECVPPRTFVVWYPGGWLWNHWGRAMVGLGVFWEFLTPARRRAFAARRAGLRVPTLIVWGEDDQLLPVTHAQSGQALMPEARLHIFPRCGHAPNIEDPPEFNRLMIEFLSR